MKQGYIHSMDALVDVDSVLASHRLLGLLLPLVLVVSLDHLVRSSRRPDLDFLDLKQLVSRTRSC